MAGRALLACVVLAGEKKRVAKPSTAPASATDSRSAADFQRLAQDIPAEALNVRY